MDTYKGIPFAYIERDTVPRDGMMGEVNVSVFVKVRRRLGPDCPIALDGYGRGWQRDPDTGMWSQFEGV